MVLDMVFGPAKEPKIINYLDISGRLNFAFLRRPRTHNYTQYESGLEYAFEAIDQGEKGYMTGQGRGVRRGDLIIIRVGTGIEQYQVKEIDYYASPSDMWTALLVKR